MRLLGECGLDVDGIERRAFALRIRQFGLGREPLAQAPTGAGDPRAHGADRDGERLPDLLVAQIRPYVQEKRVPVVARERRERRCQNAVDLGGLWGGGAPGGR